MTRLTLLLLCAIPAHALAYDSDGVKQHFGQELAECAAYFTIAAEVSNRFGNVPEGMAQQRRADRAMEMGRMLTTEELTETRFKAALESEAKINNGKNGYSRLHRKYDASCRQMMERPQQRIEYWERKK